MSLLNKLPINISPASSSFLLFTAVFAAPAVAAAVASSSASAFSAANFAAVSCASFSSVSFLNKASAAAASSTAFSSFAATNGLYNFVLVKKMSFFKPAKVNGGMGDLSDVGICVTTPPDSDFDNLFLFRLFFFCFNVLLLRLCARFLALPVLRFFIFLFFLLLIRRLL